MPPKLRLHVFTPNPVPRLTGMELWYKAAPAWSVHVLTAADVHPSAVSHHQRLSDWRWMPTRKSALRPDGAPVEMRSSAVPASCASRLVNACHGVGLVNTDTGAAMS